MFRRTPRDVVRGAPTHVGTGKSYGNNISSPAYILKPFNAELLTSTSASISLDAANWIRAARIQPHSRLLPRLVGTGFVMSTLLTNANIHITCTGYSVT